MRKLVYLDLISGAKTIISSFLDMDYCLTLFWEFLGIQNLMKSYAEHMVLLRSMCVKNIFYKIYVRSIKQ